MPPSGILFTCKHNSKWPCNFSTKAATWMGGCGTLDYSSAGGGFGVSCLERSEAEMKGAAG
jgi:hypothetical protein